MSILTVTSREFNRDASKIKSAASDNLVFITVRGKPSHVLLSIEEYKRLAASQNNIVDLLAMDNDDQIEFIAPKMKSSFKPESFD
ncbi:prevent-host-death family protein (plasmid) [Piscirickettsia salmonis]|uniref:type II toxin-antitoxin system Phd/YefM family antitoxin n=1 Tax=Piscirickettsia salmonis TaxID=1238 RepID=UPI0002D63DBE|nr:type II toxin-antitoxin system Phd/YefM family antitoxin [Piscirickettsia salmonis]RNC76787.1 prevent-host-death family protein [Piscirickettsiaceae bacterium NZ-RLO2]QGO85981.1 prevent-host-death family protein [Piscirickettsia salmonis]QGO92959.1 prevent-host-death family protein [Piscirickettsia salmonis]QGP03080.1 prevent-host-death family protein [Piscirickettsia salmonis]UOX27087.1 prevent-host-death family protein [Piscirickettsia salmonis]